MGIKSFKDLGLKSFEEMDKTIAKHRVVRSAYGEITILFESENQKECSEFFDEQTNYGDIHLIQVTELELRVENKKLLIAEMEKLGEVGIFIYNGAKRDLFNINRYYQNKKLKSEGKYSEVKAKDINLDMMKQFKFEEDEELEVVLLSDEIVIRRGVSNYLEEDILEYECEMYRE